MLDLAADEVTRIKLKGYTLAISFVGQLGEVDLANLDADADFPLPMQNTRIPHPIHTNLLEVSPASSTSQQQTAAIVRANLKRPKAKRPLQPDYVGDLEEDGARFSRCDEGQEWRGGQGRGEQEAQDSQWRVSSRSTLALPGSRPPSSLSLTLYAAPSALPSPRPSPAQYAHLAIAHTLYATPSTRSHTPFAHRSSLRLLLSRARRLLQPHPSRSRRLHALDHSSPPRLAPLPHSPPRGTRAPLRPRPRSPGRLPTRTMTTSSSQMRPATTLRLASRRGSARSLQG